MIAFVAGILDPMEGSLVILAGTLLTLAALWFGHAEHTMTVYWTWVAVLMLVGVGALWGFSALGGVGGNSGRSGWWALTMLPYPIAWLAGIRWLVAQAIADRRAKTHSA